MQNYLAIKHDVKHLVCMLLFFVGIGTFYVNDCLQTDVFMEQQNFKITFYVNIQWNIVPLDSPGHKVKQHDNYCLNTLQVNV